MKAMIVFRTLGFLGQLWRINLMSAMEYRVSFLSQIAGMILNNAIYFVFWVLFFDRFEDVRGWTLPDMTLLFAVVATSFGLTMMLFGNCAQIARIAAEGGLDAYLSLPRPVLLHVLAAYGSTASLGDLIFGLTWFALGGQFAPAYVARFLLAAFLSACVFISALVLINSLAFWLGRFELVAEQFLNAMVTFSLYPGTLFGGSARLLLFTLIPAGLTGALPVELLRNFDLKILLWNCLGALAFLCLALLVFHRGLRRYESGSAILARM